MSAVHFFDGSGWATATLDGHRPTFNGNSLTLTDNNFFEGRSAFFKAKEAIHGFSVSFVYQESGGKTYPNSVNYGPADGFTFCLQTVSPSAISANPIIGEGAGLAVAGIQPSAEVEFNIFSGSAVGTAFEVNGTNNKMYHTSARMTHVRLP
jgi:hypothetical protein